MQRRSDAARKAMITPRGADGPCPLSYAQELLWLLSQVFDDGIAYNAPATFHLQGPLDIERLQRAFAALVQRHSILRTTYTVIDGHPRQVIQPSTPLALNVVDLRHLPAEHAQREAQAVLAEESRFAFDLVHGPVLRPTVIRLAEEEQIFMLNLHHIATDGYSRTALLHDLTAFYDALATGADPGLPELPIQYADYAVWQRQWLEGGTGEQQLEYWKRQLAGAPSRLDLPNDFPRPPVRSYLGDHVSIMLDAATREGLHECARGQDATLFVAVLALFAALLGRYAGQDDVVIGTPYAGRNRSELESMVGYFINPLALRVDLSGDPSFDELVRRTRETTLAGFANADVPYETVVRATNPERDLSQTPVFQAMIVYHNPAYQNQRPKFEPAGIRCSEISHEKGWSKFDVLLGVSERKVGMNTTWEYSTELFRPDTVRRMMEHFRALGESVAAGSHRPLSRLSMLSESERSHVLVSFSAGDELPAAATAGEQPAPGTIKERFEAQAARTPGAEAVVCGEGRLTFAELNQQANRVAGLLAARGAGPGTLVGILMEKSLELVPALLGVIKAGAAYVPLDPKYPTDRLEFMLADARPTLLLTHRALERPLPGGAGEVLHVEDALAAGGPAPEDPPTLAGPDDLAYVIYTSGSTGQPKGAMVTVANLAAIHSAYEQEYRLRELRAHAQMASFSFDVFTGDVIRALPAGAKLVMCPLEVVLDPSALYELWEREGVDAVELVPATASLLFDHLRASGRRLDFMRLIAIGGEPWRTDHFEQYRSLCGPQTRLINSYGLTEATMDSTYFEPPAGAELVPGRFMPIGRPLPGSRVYVLDAALEPQPVGIPGELCIGGAGVCAGYLNRPELTSERFVADPFVAGARIYRTGDLARWLPDGTLEFVGRRDRQLKIRGFRVEPGEIEAVLERHPRVRAAAVAVREDEAGHSLLVAYLTPADPTAHPQPDELRSFVGEHVPAYMIPAAWMVLDALPTTPNGKVDVAALPAPVLDRSAEEGEFVAPRTDSERVLAEIWRELLGIDEVGVHDNFFALGGHSLLAVRLFARIEERLGVKLSLAALFQTATVADLASMVDAERGGDRRAWSSVVPMRPQESRQPFFLVGWVGGQLIGYRRLVEEFPDTVSVYGLQAPGLDGSRLPLTRIEDLAAHYIAEIRRVQPHGPYYIGGFCFAGVIAYEMARQLSEQGEELGMVALIDSYLRGTRPVPTRWEMRRERLRELQGATGPRERLEWLRGRLVHRRKRLISQLHFKTGYIALDVLERTGLPIPRRPWNLVLIASSLAARRYNARPANVRVEFFRPQAGPSDAPTPWDRLALGGVVLRPVLGEDITHESLTGGAGVPRLVQELRVALDEALAAAPAAGLQLAPLDPARADPAPANGNGHSAPGTGEPKATEESAA